MRLRARIVLLTVTAWVMAIGAIPAHAQVPLADPAFDLLTVGDVRAVARQSDGRLIVGGSFTQVGGLPRKSLARLLPDGSVDPSFAIDVDGIVRSLVIDGTAGALFIAGEFAHVGGLSRDGVARITLTGTPSVDPLWGPIAPSGNIGRRVNAMVADGTGAVIVGGAFATLGGTSIQNLARLIGSAGQVDPAWRPDPSNEVFALAVDPARGLYVSGLYSRIAGAERRSLARLELDSGALDLEFAASIFGNPPFTLAINPSSGEVAYAAVQGIQPSNIEAFSTYMGRYTVSGEPLAGIGCDCTMSALAFDGSNLLFTGTIFSKTGFHQPISGRLLLGAVAQFDPTWPEADLAGRGRFIMVDGQSVLLAGTLSSSTTPAFGVLRLHTGSGAIDSEFAASVLQPGEAMAVIETGVGDSVVGGDFVVAGKIVRRNLLRIHADGTLDSNWPVQADGPVRALLRDRDGRLMVGGEFNTLAGEPIRRLGRLTGARDDVLDATFNPPPTRPTGSEIFLPFVLALAASDNWLYVASARFSRNSSRVYEISRVGAQGVFEGNWTRRFSAPVTQLLSDGDDRVIFFELREQLLPTEPPFPQPPSKKLQRMFTSDDTLHAVRYAEVEDWGPELEWPSNIVDLKRDAAGKILVAGRLWTAGSTVSRPLLRLSNDGALDAGWQAQADGTMGRAVISDVAGNVYLDQRLSAGPPRIRRFGADGGADPDWSVEHDGVEPLRMLPNAGSLVVAGELRRIGASERSGLARLGIPAAPLLVDGFE